MTESLQNLYAKNLRQPYGYPLRFPEPTPGLPSSYAEHGLQIGDVGYVDNEGMFEVLFNICFLQDHELHRGRPKLAGLVGLTRLEYNEVRSLSNAISSTAPPICHGIKSPPGCGTRRFTSYFTSGAVLILPSGAARQKLTEEKEGEFRELAKKHAFDWCHFARRKSLYLVTGFYKTNCWRLASFHDVTPTGQIILEGDGTRECHWHSKCDLRQSGDNSKENQTVLLSGFKIEVRGWYYKYIWIEELSQRSRSFWVKLTSLASPLALLLGFLWWWMADIHITLFPALSQPFHPSDIINHYLLDKNPNARVAITHDDEWLSMLEEDESSRDVVLDAEYFQALLEEKYRVETNSDDVVYLRRKINKPNNKGNGNLSAISLKKFCIPAVSYECRQFVITRMRAENIVPCLRHMPVGFCVIVRIGGIVRRSKCNPVSLCDGIIEWNDKIVLPTDSMSKVQFSIMASFEFQPVLGNGEILYMSEMSMDELAMGQSTYFLFSKMGENTFPCPSLLITLEERRFDLFSDWGHDVAQSEREGNLPVEVTEETDKGHNALLRYHEGLEISKLEECLEWFKLALDHCPFGHGCRAAALFNLAAARLMDCQVRGRVSDLDEVIFSYRKVLELRPGHHPDRPRTLLHLAQALLYRQGKLRYESSVADEIEELANEIREICSKSSRSYDHQAADLVVQTLQRYRALVSGKLVELDKLVSQLHRSAEMPPDRYSDRPYQLINFSITLRKLFEITDHLGHIEKSISLAKEAVELIPEGHFDKPWMLASLGDAHRLRFLRCGGIADLDNSISMIEDATKLAPDGHLDRPRMHASLGDAFRVRFVQRGNVVDLDRSISMIEWAIEHIPDGHFDKLEMLNSLGDALRVRFVQRGDVADLDRSVSMIEQAMEHIPDGHFDKPRIFTSLSDALRARFVLCGDVANLDSSISMVEQAVKLIPHDHFDKLRTFTSLGDGLRVRFIQHGDIADLNSSIAMMEQAVKLTPDGHLDKSSILISLGDALRVRFVRCGGTGDLERSIHTIEQAVKLIPDGHFDKPKVLTLLGDALRMRFVQRGGAADLDRSISIIEPAVKFIPDCHLDKLRMLTSLGDAFRARFVQRGNVADLERSISMIDQAVKLTPDGYFDKPGMLTSLGDALRAHYVQRGLVADLDRSISMIEQTIRFTPDGHFDKPKMLASLGDALRVRFVQRSDVTDLDRSISMIEQAIGFTPDGHFDKPRMLTLLGDVLRVRFVQRSDIADLERSISSTEQAAKLTPDGHLDKPGVLISLGDALCVRFVQRGDVTDLDRSISMVEQAVKLTPDGHFDKPRMLPSLGDVLRTHFVEYNHVTDLGRPISMIEQAVEFIPDCHLYKPRMFTSLGDALFARFVQYGDIADLDSSISMVEQAVKLASDSYFDIPRMLTSLGDALRAHFVHRHNIGDLDRSISMIEQAVKLTPDGHLDKPWMLMSLNKSVRLHVSPSLQRKYIDLIHKISAKWVNWDPLREIKVGAYGTVENKTGKLLVEGSIYDREFQDELDKHGIKIQIADYPAHQGPEEEDFIISSKGVKRRDFNRDNKIGVPHTTNVSLQGEWSIKSGKREAILIMRRPRLTSLPRDVVLQYLYKTDKLTDKWLVTSIRTCPAYCMYLSDKKSDEVSLALVAKAPIAGATGTTVPGAAGFSWHGGAQSGHLRKVCDKAGRYLFTPVFTIQRSVHRSTFRYFREWKGEPMGDDLWHNAYPPWDPLDEEGEEDISDTMSEIESSE